MFKQLSAATSILLAFFGAAPAGAQPGAICAQSGVVAGGDHTCAFTVLGAAMCWGDNQFGQVGNGAISTSVLVPTRVSGLMPATNGAGQPPTFVAGQRHTCAIVLPGMTPMCWGDRGAGQLGDGQIGGLSLTPVPVVADPAHAPFPAFTLAAGDSHTCAIDTGLHVQCWGDDRVGQLGDGRSGAGASSANPTFPVAAPSILDAPAIDLAAGIQHTCAVMQDHTARCWGDNSFCQIGDDSRCQVGNAIASSPVTRPQGVLYGRGLPGIGPFLVDVVQVAAGESHTCALLNGPAFPSNGNVTCWGTGDEGELGNPGTTFDAIPGAVVDSSGATSSRLSGVREIAAGLHHTCALMNGGTVQCWGSNSNGQLGRPGANSFPPVTVIDANAVTAPSGQPLSGVAHIVAGNNHTCAALSAGGVVCWGQNFLDQLGASTAPNTSTPAPISVGGLCTCPGLTLCNGQCSDTTSDPGNCGHCGHVCPSEICTNSACVDGAICRQHCEDRYSGCLNNCVADFEACPAETPRLNCVQAYRQCVKSCRDDRGQCLAKCG